MGEGQGRRWFGTDGIRGRLGKVPMTPEFIAAVGAAAGKLFSQTSPQGKVLIARDTRGSGPMLEAALISGLKSAGLTVELAGVLPSGAAAMLVPARGACAGAILSASHNPATDNGIKFCGANGSKLTDEEEVRLESGLDWEHPPAMTEKIRELDFSCRDWAIEGYRKK